MKFDNASDPAVIAQLNSGQYYGVVKGLANKDYHSKHYYFSSTQLKVISIKSPSHFREYYFGKNKDEANKQTAAMIDGSLFHNRVLEPERFDQEFFIMPDLNFRTNDGKARREELLSLNLGKTAISHDMLLESQAMCSSVNQHKTASALFDGAEKEIAVFWKCPFTSLNFRAKLDGVKENKMLELKSATSAKPVAFAKQTFDLGYDLSLAHYVEGWRQVTDKTLEPRFIVTEKTAPYVTEVYKVDDGFMLTGHNKWLDAVTKLSHGINDNSWPSYNSDDEEAMLFCPAWALKQLVSGEQEHGI